MIDIIAHTPDKATLVTWAETHGLRQRHAIAWDTDPDSPTYGEETAWEWRTKPGVEWCWWAGSGKLMRSPGTYDAEGNELTAPVYVAGLVAIIRLSGEFFGQDRLDAEPDAEQWARSKVIRYIRQNGQLGQTAGIAFVEMDGVRLFRPSDVQAKLADWGVAGHEWLGGNTY